MSTSKTKSTKRALLCSIMSLIICFAMLIGTTFAWFTDSVSSTGNKIQAGTLDVDLVDEDGNSLEGETLKWVVADGRAQEDILWEPGCTYNLQPVIIKNNGNLALKYKVEITGINGDAKLNEVIDWTIDGVDIAAEGHLAAGEQTEAITISGHMQETAGNDYQNLSIDDIAITVVATQDTVESDSFDNQYDVNAVYPVRNTSELNAALTNAQSGDTIQLAASTFTFDSPIVIDKSLNIEGVNGSRIESVIIGKNNAQLTIKNVAFGGKSYIWNQGLSELTLSGCDINVSVAKDPNVNNAGWRASFVSLGSNEGNSIKLDIRNNTFVTDTARYWGDDSHGDANGNYTPAIFGWAKIKNGSVISGNVFGSADNRFGFLVTKLMNFEDQATVTISNNTVYGTTYWGSEFHAFDLFQNTSRANEYTANFSNNNVDVALVENDYGDVPSNYFLHLEVMGNSTDQMGHATVNIDNSNKYNGSAVNENVCDRMPWPNPGTINFE